jgi:hypothetical protein
LFGRGIGRLLAAARRQVAEQHRRHRLTTRLLAWTAFALAARRGILVGRCGFGKRDPQRSLRGAIQRLEAADLAAQPQRLCLQLLHFALGGPLPAARPRFHRGDE